MYLRYIDYITVVNYDKTTGQWGGLLSGLFNNKTVEYNANTQKFISGIKKLGSGLTSADISGVTKQFDDLDDEVVRISKNMVGANFNAKEYEKALKGISSTSRDVSGTLKMLGGVIASMAITFAIEETIKLTYSLATANKRLFDEASKVSSEYESSEKDIDSYKNKIQELQKKINDSSTSYEDAKEARRQLLGIQDELISKYDSEKSAIQDITAAINGQVDALDRLKDSEYIRLLGEYNNPSWLEHPIDNVANWANSLAYGLADWSMGKDFDMPSRSDILMREMAHSYASFKIPDEDLALFKKNADKFKNIIIDDYGNVQAVNEIHNLRDSLSELFVLAENSGASEKGLNRLSKQINNLNNQIDSGEGWTDQQILRNSILGKNSNLNIESQYEAYLKAQENYETAVLNGNQNLAEDMALKMSDIYQNIYQKYIPNGLSGEERQVLNYIERQSPDVNLSIAKFKKQIEQDFTFEPQVKINDAKIAQKEDLVNDLSDYLREEIDKATELGVDLNNTVYGNIDTAFRDSLTWTDENLEKYKEAIESWNFDPDELRNSVSTVLGSLDEIDGLDIAYSPMLETDQGLELLSQDTVDKYLKKVLKAAGDDQSLENILKIDAEGFEVDGQRIKKLIADVGETAEKTSQSMHFTGVNGSIQGTADAIASLDNELNKLYTQNNNLTLAFETTLAGRLQNAIGMTDITVEKLNEMDSLAQQYGEERLKDLGYTKAEIKVYHALSEILGEQGVKVSEATHSMQKMHIIASDLQKQLRNTFNSQDVKDYINTLNAEQLSILLKADLDEDATLSEVKHAIEKGQYLADNTPIELKVTTKLDVATSDISENVENAFSAIESAYKSMLDSDGNFVAGTIDFSTQKSLAEIFGNTEGFEKYIDVLSDVTTTEAEYQKAHDELISNYINSSQFYDQVTESTANQIEAMLRANNVVNAHEIVVDALNAKLKEEEAKTQAVALADEYCAQAKTSLTEVSEKAEQQAYDDVIAFLEEKGASEETKAAIINLILATDAFSSTTIDISSKLNNLASLCTALGETELAAYAAAAAVESIGVAQQKVKAGTTGDERLGITAGAATPMAGTYASKDSVNRYVQSRLKSSGSSHAANIRGLKTDWGKAKQTAVGGSGGGKGGSGGGGGGSSSPKSDSTKDATEQAKEDEEELEDTYDEFFDYFERRVKVVTDAISLLDAHLENVVGSKAKNKLLDAQERLYKMQQQEYSDARDMYQEMADKALEKIPDNLREDVKNGAVALDEFIGKEQEDIVNAINDYTKWADKIAECTQHLAELKEQIRQLELNKMKNILQDWQDVFDLRQNNAIDLIDKQIALIEQTGEAIGSAFYEQQKSQSEKQLQALQQAKNELVTEFNRGLSNGSIEKGTDEWIEEVDLINQVEQSILDCKKAIDEYDNAILNIHTEVFERIQNKFDDFDDQLSDIASFIEDIDVGNKFGEWSKEGIARAGMLAQQYEMAQKRVSDYADEIAWLNEQYKLGKFSTLEYVEKLADLMSAQRDAAQDAENYKDAIIDLNRARIDIEINAIEEEIDAYNELIQKQKDALSAEKDLHDYRKQIADSNKTIEQLERQIAAMQGDNTAATVAKRKQLEQQLADARQNLEEQEYDHSISAQQDALDQQAQQYEDMRNAEIDALNAYLEQTETVLFDTFEAVKLRAIEVGQVISQTAQEHGVEISSTLINAWSAGENAIASYGDVLSSASSEFISRLNGVEEETWNLQEQANLTSESIAEMFANNADNLVYELQRSWESESNLNNMTRALEESFVAALEAGYRIDQVGGPMASAAAATEAVADAANSAADAFDDMASSARSAASAAREAQAELSKVDNGHHTTYIPGRGDVYWDAVKDSKGRTISPTNVRKGTYAKGLSKAEKDELAWTQELGDEVIVSPTRNSILTPIKKNDSVLTAEMTKNLWELAKIDPKQLLNNSKGSIPVSQIQSNNSSVQIGTLVNVEGSISDNNLADVKQTIQEELKKTFRNINSGLRR